MRPEGLTIHTKPAGYAGGFLVLGNESGTDDAGGLLSGYGNGRLFGSRCRPDKVRCHNRKKTDHKTGCS